MVSRGNAGFPERKGKDMEAFTVTVTIHVEGDNYEPEAMEEAIQEWVASRLGTPDIISIVADDYEVRKVEVA
jgi:hypothetical protein